MGFKINICILINLSTLFYSFTDGVCIFPEYFRAKYFSTDRTNELHTLITATTFSNEQLGLSYCHHFINTQDSFDTYNKSDIRILLHNRAANCYQCQDILYRTPNVLQHRFSSCVNGRPDDVEELFESVCNDISPFMDYETLFRVDLLTVNCKNTFEGCFHYTYEVDFGGGSICDSPQNTINACQRPGSVYVDNQVFDMSSGECSDVVGSYNSKIRFQCMGSWDDGKGNVYSAISDIGAVKNRERFRCMLTRYDQEMDDNQIRYSVSRWASCSVLKTPYDGDIRLILEPMIYDQIPALDPGCRFPRNFTGTYYMGGELDHGIVINTTHIYKETILNQYQTQKTFFICMGHVDSRYLTFTIDEGRCETHFVCYDFRDRHHSLVRFRMGRPISARLSRLGDPEYMERVFRETCTWSTFTFIRSDGPEEWIYNYFMMDPPSPVTCPIGGRYTFVQDGSEEEKYKTEVENAYTERPRHLIDCQDQSTELKSCDANPFKIAIDVDYCDTLDHTGKPIGEYDIADRELICLGHWMENMKSFMITFDWLDQTSTYRCWIYERTGWRYITMSRSSSAHCDVAQTAFSDSPDEGSSLRIRLKESERLWDSCSQRYDTGVNPWNPVLDIFLLDENSASTFDLSFFITCAFILFHFLIFNVFY